MKMSALVLALGPMLAGLAGCAFDSASEPVDSATAPTATTQQALAVPACIANGDKQFCAASIFQSDGSYTRYWRSHGLTNVNSGVERAVIVIHGAQREPWAYFDHVQDAAAREGLRESTAVIAPYFPIASEAYSRERYWDGGGWKQGDRDLYAGTLSSFALVDQLIEKLTEKVYFPNLKSIAIVGHSAGGVFTQRYAAASSAPSGYAMRYVVSNPSSYMYLDGKRPMTSSGSLTFDLPARNAYRPCSDDKYNEYQYGLEARNYYAGQVDDALLISRYKSRKVIYLLGQLDTETSGDGLDVTCSAKLQGWSRLQRGRYFDAYMESVHNTYHRRIEVANVGHSAEGMFQSTGGRVALFY